jgi:hypothetical protein
MCALAIAGCQKDAPDPGAPVRGAQEDLESRILAFVERANSGARDGGALITADSAEWYVEAALNFSNADLTIAYNDAAVDSITYTLPLSNGMADEANALAAYNALNPLVAASNIADISHVVIVDVTSRNTVDELILTVAYVVGSGYEKALNTTYTSTDFWLWKSNFPGNSAACSTNTSTSHQGADYRIQQRINQELAAIGNNVYMVSVETWTVMPFSDVPNNIKAYSDFPVAGSPYGYRSYGCYGVGCSTCLTPSHMTFFTQGTWDVMNLIKATYCPTKKAQQCTIVGNLTTCLGCTEKWHMAQFRYGIIPK